VHVPFCERLCPFCPYNKVIYRPGIARDYFAALRSEVEAYRPELAEPFTSLYVGGGTPTLALEELAPIVERIPVDGERAIEVLPAHATASGIDRIRDCGFDYVSLGVQSFDGRLLRHLGRPTDPESNRTALRRAAGRFACVDVDLIFDIAFADEGTFLNDVRTCLEHGVDQVSTYPLMRFGFTPFGKADHDRRAERIALGHAEELAARHGYRRGSVWTFVREGAPTYSSITRPFYLGLGAGAASYTGSHFLVNHFSPQRYGERLRRGELPHARVRSLGRLASSAYYAFWQAYAGRVEASALRQHFGALPAAAWRAGLSILAGCGLGRRSNGTFALTRRGLEIYHDLERWVTYRFIEPLWGELTQELSAFRHPPSAGGDRTTPRADGGQRTAPSERDPTPA
jgi:oxygen-independent coproporphyrinogen-3 oxidase